MNKILSLRPARAEDEPFLRNLRGKADSERLAMARWQNTTTEEKSKILDLQFVALNAHYNILKNNWDTKENVIELDAAPVGRFVISGDGKELRLTELSLLPQYRGMGIREYVIKATMNECAETNRSLRICVEKSNMQAHKRYAALGFYIVDQSESHVFIEWNSKGPGKGKIYNFGNSAGGPIQK